MKTMEAIRTGAQNHNDLTEVLKDYQNWGFQRSKEEKSGKTVIITLILKSKAQAEAKD
jgi:hypothetical protein